MDKRICVSLNLDLAINRYHKVLEGIQDYAEKNTDWTLIWDHCPEYTLQESSTSCYDGVIGRIRKPSYDAVKRFNLPLVNLLYNNPLKGLPSVLVDFEKAGVLTAEHLLRRGFKKIVSVDADTDSSTAYRKGLKSTLEPYGIELKCYSAVPQFSDSHDRWKKQRDLFNRWRQEWEFPIAVCSSASEMGIAVSAFCNASRINIPEELALIVVGEENSYCAGLKPHITSVDTDYFTIGYQAAAMLNRQFKFNYCGETIYIPPSELHARESTDIYVIDDPVVRKVLRYIADNIHRNLTVNDLVDVVPVSRSSLEHRFSDCVGHSITSEINRVRILAAKRFLADEEIKVSEVSRKAGFSSSLHLRRIFKKHTGQTPTEYRINLQTAHGLRI